MASLPSKLLRIGIIVLPLLASVGAVNAQGYPPPPTAQTEVVPAPPPGPPGRWVWRPGAWEWNGHRYVWVAGRYYRAPHRNAAWVPAHWVQRRGAWVWVRGHWR